MRQKDTVLFKVYGIDRELRQVACGRLPPEEEKMAATEGATVGLQQPEESFFHAVAHTHAAKLDGFAIRAA